MEKEITRKSIFLTNWKSKIGYSLNYKDIEELETIIDYYEIQLKKQKEINKRAIEYIKDYSSYINYLSPDKHKEIGHLETYNVKELLQILEDKEV